MDVTDVDLTPFRQKGGKIILTHGLMDDLITPGNSIDYYRRHLQRQGRQKMDSFFRFYLIPGFGHGFGAFKATFDSLGTLDRWVDKDEAPGTLTSIDANVGSKRTRPMCLYPSWPEFSGPVGSSLDEASHFTCVAR